MIALLPPEGNLLKPKAVLLKTAVILLEPKETVKTPSVFISTPKGIKKEPIVVIKLPKGVIMCPTRIITRTEEKMEGYFPPFFKYITAECLAFELSIHCHQIFEPCKHRLVFQKCLFFALFENYQIFGGKWLIPFCF